MIEETSEDIIRELEMKTTSNINDDNKMNKVEETLEIDEDVYLVAEESEREVIRYYQTIIDERESSIYKLLKVILIIVIMIIPRMVYPKYDSGREMMMMRRNVREIVSGVSEEIMVFACVSVKENRRRIFYEYEKLISTDMRKIKTKTLKVMGDITAIGPDNTKHRRTFTRKIENSILRLVSTGENKEYVESFTIMDEMNDHKREMTIILGKQTTIDVIVKIMRLKLDEQYCMVINDNDDEKAILIMIGRKVSIYEYDYLLCAKRIKSFVNRTEGAMIPEEEEVRKGIERLGWKKQKIYQIGNTEKEIRSSRINACKIKGDLIVTNEKLLDEKSREVNHVMMIDEGLYIRCRRYKDNVVWYNALGLKGIYKLNGNE